MFKWILTKFKSSKKEIKEAEIKKDLIIVDLPESFNIPFKQEAYMICNRIEVLNNIITFKGYYVSSFANKYYQGYKNSTVDYILDEEETEEIYKIEPTEIVEKYREFETKNNRGLDNLKVGKQFGDFLFKKQMSKALSCLTIAEVIKQLEIEEFELNTYKLTVTAFEDKEYAIVQYYKKWA